MGDHVGVGCFVDSCLECDSCKDGDENYCDGRSTTTYNGNKTHGRAKGSAGSKTWGGYSGSNVVDERFVCKIPEGLPLEFASPILCAGITMYSPLKDYGGLEGKKLTIGIVGIGGLGTMGVKIARALGHDVVAISSSANKEAIAKEKGATHFCVSKDPESMKAHAGIIDILLNTVSATHEYEHYLPLIHTSGTYVAIGANMKPFNISQTHLVKTRIQLTGSIIGGVRDTQEVLNLCAKHQIWPDCELINADKIGWAWD